MCQHASLLNSASKSKGEIVCQLVAAEPRDRRDSDLSCGHNKKGGKPTSA